MFDHLPSHFLFWQSCPIGVLSRFGISVGPFPSPWSLAPRPSRAVWEQMGVWVHLHDVFFFLSILHLNVNDAILSHVPIPVMGVDEKRITQVLLVMLVMIKCRIYFYLYYWGYIIIQHHHSTKKITKKIQ